LAAGGAWDHQQQHVPQQQAHAKLLASQSFNCSSQPMSQQMSQQHWQQPYHHQQDRNAAAEMRMDSMQHAPLQPCWPGLQQQGAQWMTNAQQQLPQQYTSLPGSLPPLACMPTWTEREQQQQLPQLINTGKALVRCSK
jgi:hypothetical protein